jgi:hypothetical protein
MSDSEDILAGGGPKLPAAKFTKVGDTAKGTVTAVKKAEDRDPSGTVKRWDNGDVRYVYIITLDDAQNIWARGQMVKAIQEAGRKAGATTLVGCELAVKYVGDGEQKKAGYTRPKQFAAQVKVAAPAATEDFFN